MSSSILSKFFPSTCKSAKLFVLFTKFLNEGELFEINSVKFLDE